MLAQHVQKLLLTARHTLISCALFIISIFIVIMLDINIALSSSLHFDSALLGNIRCALFVIFIIIVIMFTLNTVTNSARSSRNIVYN